MPAAAIAVLDAHEQPSGYLRSRWKAYARATPDEIEQADDIDEVDNGALLPAGTLPHGRVSVAFDDFLSDGTAAAVEPGIASTTDIPVYAHPLLPGLLVIPALIPPAVQTSLLDRMVHRDLSRPCHQTNLHPHYVLPYPPGRASFFSYPSDNKNDSATRAKAATFRPKDPAVHRPLSISQVLERRLHWVTLGGQYDWTHRVYPEGSIGTGSSDDDDDDDDEDILDDSDEKLSPRFPPRLARLLKGLFPETKAQAAIVNFYTPGDTMMMHRDVSEETDKGLISLSMGCDALFMAAPTREFGETDGTQPATEDGDNGPCKKKPYVLLRLRSGDAIYMTGHARFAWHGVPKVIKGTCPDFLAEWPAGEHDDGRYEAWRGWMRNKRVNLNARQMRD
ncbi:2og-Fe oxygenase family protein [Grosmannia clavigera kw1407]|uniref:mRNA N(6)-methyladenine demethylase n=1 Tax=Grosmannia clavigera (strain kw1407 / UAMH 11150) TaxID=655863 RepID=F0X9P2_GROCL|nr:2og-Fe oxygenase family protein [Grosmannia clavigera kw1407]EFX05779.1 2og-Fe oxygenase family protein [Grosmannia clavigera kw1407]